MAFFQSIGCFCGITRFSETFCGKVPGYHCIGIRELDRAMSSAQRAFGKWERTSAGEKAAALNKMAARFGFLSSVPMPIDVTISQWQGKVLEVYFHKHSRIFYVIIEDIFVT